MANRKISDFTALTAPASSDVLAIIDISESTAADKNKKITYANVLSKAPDGSAAAPSISFNSDQDTGISGGSNTLTLSTGGTARLTISSAGVVTIPGDLTVSGTTTHIDSTTLDVKDKNIRMAVVGSPSNTTADGGGISVEGGSDGDKLFRWVSSTDAWTSSEHIDLASGKVLKVAGTQVLSATQYTGNAATASAVTNLTVAAESTDTSCSVLFTTAASGSLPPKTATTLTFNSNTGALTATSFVGALTGNVTGNTSGTAATVTGAAQSNITSVGTLTSLASGAITTTDNLSVDNAKEVRLYEADSNGSAYVGIKGATDKGSDASYTVSLPSAAPTANQILKADASTPTNLTWATDSGGIPDTGGTFTGKVTHNYTSSLRVPAGTTGQRDGSPGNGDFRYNSTTSKFEGYQGGSWGEIGGGGSGNADLLDIASSSGTGGGGSTFDGSRYRFKLVTKGTSDAVTPVNAEILRVSIAGVMQQPNDGTGQGDMTEGYVVDGTDIIFDSAPPSGASYFIVNLGTQIAIGNATTFTVADESSDTSCNVLFTTAATGDLAPKSGTNLTFNSSSGALTATSFVGALTGASSQVTVADESSDTTCFPLFATAATGDLAPKSGTNLTFNSATGALTATSFVGDGSTLTGIASTSLDGCGYQNDQTISSGTYTIASGKGMHSVGPITNNGTVTVNGVWIIS